VLLWPSVVMTAGEVNYHRDHNRLAIDSGLREDPLLQLRSGVKTVNPTPSPTPFQTSCLRACTLLLESTFRSHSGVTVKRHQQNNERPVRAMTSIDHSTNLAASAYGSQPTDVLTVPLSVRRRVGLVSSPPSRRHHRHGHSHHGAYAQLTNRSTSFHFCHPGDVEIVIKSGAQEKRYLLPTTDPITSPGFSRPAHERGLVAQIRDKERSQAEADCNWNPR